MALILAEYMNPAIFAILLGFVFLTRGRVRDRFAFAAVSVLSIAAACFLAEQGKAAHMFQNSGSFPSGHETFGLTCGFFVVVWARWTFSVVTVWCIILGWALVAAHFHHTVDVFGSIIPSGIVCAIAWLSIRTNLLPPGSLDVRRAIA